MNSGCCAPCGSCCPTACGGSCGSGSCASCTPTEIRNKAVPDPISNERSDDRDSRDRRFEGNSGDYNDDPSDRRGVGDDDFGGGNSDWNPSREEAPDPGADGFRGSETDRTPPPFNRNSEDIPGLNGFERSQRPPMDGFGSGTDVPEAGSETEGDGDVESILNRGANKPPINLPVEEGTNDSDTSEAAPGTTPAPGEGADIGTEAEPGEFLGPDIEGGEGTTEGALRSRLLSRREARSSHFGVLSTERLAGSINRSATSRHTSVSSREDKQQPVRWISLPAPAGRVRS